MGFIVSAKSSLPSMLLLQFVEYLVRAQNSTFLIYVIGAADVNVLLFAPKSASISYAESHKGTCWMRAKLV